MITEHYSGNLSLTADFATRSKAAGFKVVLTQGCFDLLHVGHLRYLEQAKKLGGILIVAVDTNARVRKRKGIHRPVISGGHRLELIAGLRAVDWAFLRGTNVSREKMLNLIKPDVFVLTRGTHTREELSTCRRLVGEIVEFPRQARTSTTQLISLTKPKR